MTVPDFLSYDDVVAIHQDQTARYGGSPGIRDLGLLQSALAQPRVTFEGQFLHANLFEMASAYLFHLVKNHPFMDANKRTGAVAALVFLELNGVEIESSEAEFEELVLEAAQGRREKPSISQFFKEHANKTAT